MFNYVKVNFPNTTLQPEVLYSATLKQNRFQHEMVHLNFRDWGVEYSVISAGSPIHIKFYGTTSSRDFYGYVHHVTPNKTPGKNFVEIVALSASMVMKQPAQKIWTNITADQVIKKIAAKHNFLSKTVPHPRVYPQIAQTGHTDWEFMVRLAKQSGYSLRTENTELYFQPILEEYTNYRSEARKFVQRSVESIDGSTLYSFNPTIGGFQFTYSVYVVPSLPFALRFGVDGISLFFILLTNIFMYLCILSLNSTTIKLKEVLLHLLFLQ